MSVESDRPDDPDSDPVAFGPGDRTDEWVDLTAIYVGGPQDGETEEISAGPEPGDASRVVRLVGFEYWPNAHPFRPTGRYEPDRIEDGVAFFNWQAYAPDHQLDRQREAERGGMVTQADALTRVVNKLFWGTPIIDWNVRRVMRQQRKGEARSQEDADGGEGGAANR